MQGGTLLQGGADGAVQAVLEVEDAAVLHHVGEQVPVEGESSDSSASRSRVRLVVTSSSSRTRRGGTSAHCLGVVRPCSGYGRPSPTALKITGPV